MSHEFIIKERFNDFCANGDFAREYLICFLFEDQMIGSEE